MAMTSLTDVPPSSEALADGGGGENIEEKKNTDVAATEDKASAARGRQDVDAKAGHKEGDGEEGELLIEQPLFTIKEVFVYRVPPLRASSGHRAEEWGLANPVFTGETGESSHASYLTLERTAFTPVEV